MSNSKNWPAISRLMVPYRVTLEAEINHRIASAGIAWHQLKSGKVWCRKYVMLARKVLILRSVVLTILLYGCDTWPAFNSHIQRLEVFQQMNCLRVFCGFTRRDHQPNKIVRHSCKLPCLAGEVRFRCLRRLGHVARMPDDRQPVQVLLGQFESERTRCQRHHKSHGGPWCAETCR